MVRKIGFGLLWIGFVSYAFLLAPPNQLDTFELIQRLSTGDWQGINPLIIALFNLMGVWPMIYACLLLADGRNQKLRAWPFLVGSLGLGAFTLLPYLALRQPNSIFTGSKNWLIRILDARITGVLLAAGAIALLIYGFTQGNWSDYIYEWQTRRFVHVMSWDFVLLCLIFPALLGDDMARRGWHNRPTIFWLVALLPLSGPLVYLIIRPSLQPTNPENPAPAQPEPASVA